MSSIKLSDTQNFCAPFVNWLDLTAGIDDNPLIGAANLALQTIVSPPFSWPWNRNNIEFNATQGVQDYAINIDDFGYLEAASVQMMAEITSVIVTNGVATFQAVNNFASLLNNGPVPTQISGCTTSALNGTQTIQAATPTSFTCTIAIGDLVEDESGAEALAGPIMSLENKILALTDASEQDRPTFICELLHTELPDTPSLNFTLSLDGTNQTTLNVGNIINTGELMMMTVFRQLISSTLPTVSSSITDSNNNEWSLIFNYGYTDGGNFPTAWRFETWIAYSNATFNPATSPITATINGGNGLNLGLYAGWSNVGTLITQTSPQDSSGASLSLSGLTTSEPSLVLAIAGGFAVNNSPTPANFTGAEGAFSNTPLGLMWHTTPTGTDITAPAGDYSVTLPLNFSGSFPASGFLASFKII